MAILKAVDMVTSPAAEEREELLAAAGRPRRARVN
jgi:hypothetical protein